MHELVAPMTDYAQINRLIKTIEEIDKLRRDAWNDEKFGDYNKSANEALELFNSDDIPF